MVFLRAFGIPDDDTEANMFFDMAFKVPMRQFKGYTGTYNYMNVGHAEFSVGYEKNDREKPDLKNADIHFMGDTVYKMKIVEVQRNKDMGCCCFCSPLNDEKTVIPVEIIMSDVLPSIVAGDVITFQGTAFLLMGNLYSTKKEFTKKHKFELLEKQFKEKNLPLCLIVPLKYLMRFSTSNDAGKLLDAGINKECASIYTKVKNLQMHDGANLINRIAGKHYPQAYTVEACTSFGKMNIVIPPEIITAEIIKEFEAQEEMYLDGCFVLSGDVAIHEYQDGAIYDEDHLLSLLRHCLENGDFNRLRNSLSDDCFCIGYEDKTFVGKDNIIKHLSESFVAQHSSYESVQHQFMGKITGILDEKAEYSVGKRCLLPKNGHSDDVICRTFIELDDEHKICAIKFTYNSYYEFKIDEPDIESEIPKITEAEDVYDFGYSIKNPILTRSIPEAYDYLKSIKLENGNDFKLKRQTAYATEKGDRFIDAYELIVCSKDGVNKDSITLYINSYSNVLSVKLPEGFVRKQ